MLVAAAMGLIAFVAALIFSRRIREQQEQRDWTDSVPAEGNVSFTDTGALQPIGQPTGLSAEAQAARQPALVHAQELPREPAPQSVPQAEWTTECDTAVAALVCLRIPKCESIALVRQSAGTTADEITRNALRIRGQDRGQSPQLLNGHAPLPNTSAPATQVPVIVQKQSNVTAEAIAALVLLGIPEHNAAAQPRLKTGSCGADLLTTI
jgi:hypothetical protein